MISLSPEEALLRLKKSTFRSRFHLSEKDILFCKEKGAEIVSAHARDFIDKRISADYPKNDGKQTPMRGHPVFIAQHATATCCRGCIEKWYHIPQGKALSDEEKTFICQIIMSWIEKEGSF